MGVPNTRTELPKRPRVGVAMTSTWGWRGPRTSRVLDFVARIEKRSLANPSTFASSTFFRTLVYTIVRI